MQSTPPYIKCSTAAHILWGKPVWMFPSPFFFSWGHYRQWLRRRIWFGSGKRWKEGNRSMFGRRWEWGGMQEVRGEENADVATAADLEWRKDPPSLTQDDLPHPLSPPVPFTCFSHILQGGGKKKKTSTQKMRKFTGKFPKRPKKRIISRFQSFPSNGERRQKGKNRPGRPSSILFLPLFLLVSRSFPLPYQSGGGASFLPPSSLSSSSFPSDREAVRS